MERYYVNNSKKGLAWVLVVFGGLLVIFWLVLLIRYWMGESNSEFSLLSIILFLFQGVTLLILGAFHLRSGRYYLEWNEEVFRYFLPWQKGVKVIRIGDIEAVEIKLFEIQLKMADGERSIDLEHVQFEEIKRIKEKFEEIKAIKENK